MKTKNKIKKKKEEARKIVNKAKINQIKTYIKKFKASIQSQSRDLQNSEKIFTIIQKKVDKAAKTNTIHKNKANRIKSALITEINKLKNSEDKINKIN